MNECVLANIYNLQFSLSLLLDSSAASLGSPYSADTVRSASRSKSMGMRDARASARAFVRLYPFPLNFV